MNNIIDNKNEEKSSINPLSVAYVGNVEQVLDMSARRLVREALTLIEAAIPDGSNQKAVKDSLKQIIWKNIKNIKNEVEQGSFFPVGSDTNSSHGVKN